MNISEKVSNVIDMSEVAREELVRLEVNKEEFLRITMIPGGCSGLTYQMDTDTVQTPFDEIIYEDDKVKAVTDKNSLQYLKGLYIDYSSDLIDVGFRFSNPNAVHTCGCGHSATFE